MSARVRIRPTRTGDAHGRRARQTRTADADAVTCYVWIFGRSTSARRFDRAWGGYRVDENWGAKPIARAEARP